MEDCLEDLGICLVGPMRKVLGIHHFIEAELGTEMIIEANTNTIDKIKLVDEIAQKSQTTICSRHKKNCAVPLRNEEAYQRRLMLADASCQS